MMDDLNTKIRAQKKSLQQEAIKFVTTWAQRAMDRQFEEPIRKGTPKGDPIGPSRKKYHAALLMPLHPKCLNLKAIADMVGTSENVIRVWRTQEGFKKMVSEAHRWIAEVIAETIDRLVDKSFIRNQKQVETDARELFKTEASAIGILSEGVLRILKSRNVRTDETGSNAKLLESATGEPIEKTIEIDDTKTIPGMEEIRDPFGSAIRLSRLVLFLDAAVYPPFIERMKKRLDDGMWEYADLFLIGMKEERVWDEKRLREWNRTPAILDLTKAFISASIHDLIDPDNWKANTPDQRRQQADRLRKTIFDTLDILAT